MPDLKIGTIEGRESGVVTDVQQLKYQLATAWVNFDGTASPITIRDSFNVSSITDDGTGVYAVNFANALDNTNFSVAGFTNLDGSAPRFINERNVNRTTSSVGVSTQTSAESYTDRDIVHVNIFGGKN